MQVGKMLANTLKYAFFDTDTMVEMAHDKKAVSEIFAEYGQEYFRNCETEVGGLSAHALRFALHKEIVADDCVACCIGACGCPARCIHLRCSSSWRPTRTW